MEITPQFVAKINKNSLYTLLGIRIEKAESGRAESRLDANPHVCWPVPGQPHGGILFTLMDTTMGWAALASEGIQDGVTIHLDIHYVNPARGEPLTCVAWVIHRTGRTCFMQAEIRGSDGALVATGQSTYRVFKKTVSEFVP